MARYRGPGQLAAPERLLTELHLLVVAPLVHGRGKRLLAEPGDKMPLTLAGSAAFQTGVLNLTCARA